MALTFADTHNMIAYLTKSDESEGFDQIIDFLNVSSIKYALTLNPNIYVSCIKQFWSSVSVKKVNDLTRLQALVDRKKVIITEATIREALRLDDAESIDCLPNEEIFTELSRMWYENPSTKLTFYKAFFSSQWKFLIHTILQCMSAKRTSWNEFSSSMASAVICLSTGRKFNYSKYIFDSLMRNVDSSTKFYMYLRFLRLMIRAQVSDLSLHSIKYSSPALTQKVFANMRRVGNGFSRVDTPLFEGMIVAQQDDDVADEGAASVAIDDVPAAIDEPSIPSPTPTTQPPPPSQELPSTSQIAQTLEITKLKQRVKKLERRNKLKVSKLRRLNRVGVAQSVDTSEDTVMDDDVAAVEKDAEIEENRKGVVIRDPEETATPSIIIHSKPNSKDKGKGIMVKEPKPLKKQAQIEQDEAYARELETELNKNIDWDEVIEQVQRKEKEDNAVIRYQALKRKPQTEAQAKMNMMIYLRNMPGFKMDYFKGMSYDDICPIFEKKFNSNVAFLEKTREQMEEEESKALKRASESQAEKAAKKQKLDEEVKELKKHL
nr:hypothetical protein [Tanacetum cinerariifolium]